MAFRDRFRKFTSTSSTSSQTSTTSTTSTTSSTCTTPPSSPSPEAALSRTIQRSAPSSTPPPTFSNPFATSPLFTPSLINSNPKVSRSSSNNHRYNNNNNNRNTSAPASTTTSTTNLNQLLLRPFRSKSKFEKQLALERRFADWKPPHRLKYPGRRDSATMAELEAWSWDCAAAAAAAAADHDGAVFGTGSCWGADLSPMATRWSGGDEGEESEIEIW